MLAETHDPRVPGMWSAHPDIAPHVGGPLDFSGAGHATYLTGGFGCFAFEPQGPGRFEGHVMLTRPGRGKWGLAALRFALTYMAERGASLIWCRIPHRAAAIFARKAGFTPSRPLADETPTMEWRPECHL